MNGKTSYANKKMKKKEEKMHKQQKKKKKKKHHYIIFKACTPLAANSYKLGKHTCHIINAFKLTNRYSCRKRHSHTEERK